MTEITLTDAARAIRPFLPSLAGLAAAELDQRLTQLLAAADAGDDVEDQLADVLGLAQLAAWTTYFLEHGEPLSSWGEHRRLVGQPPIAN